MILLSSSIIAGAAMTGASAQNSTSAETGSPNETSSGSNEEEEQSNQNATSSSDSSAEDSSGSNSTNSNGNNATSSEPSDATSDESNDGNTTSSYTNSTASEEQSSNQNTTSTETSESAASNSTATDEEQSAEQSPNDNSTLTEPVQESPAVENATQQIVPLVAISGEPLLLAESSVIRSFTYPLLYFEGEVVDELATTITWNLDGTTRIAESRGYTYTLSIPPSQGNFTLWQNSTVIDQKVVGLDTQYDIYWRAVQDTEKGYVNRYKFTIVGSSLNGSAISLKVNGGNYLKADGNGFVITRPNSNDDIAKSEPLPSDSPLNWNPKNYQNASLTNFEEDLSLEDADEEMNGLELDWSDAIKSGHDMFFNSEQSMIEIPVPANSSFVIDPEIVSSNAGALSPPASGVFEGQRRILTTTNGTMDRINVFFSTGNGLVYRTSDDEGETWSSSISLSTGSPATDVNRWSMTTSFDDDAGYVNLFYWNSSGSNTNFYTLRGELSDLDITWSQAVLLGTASNNDTSCTTGVCAAVAANIDSYGTIYAAFRWLAGGTTNYSYIIKRSNDTGQTWTDSLPQVDGISTSKFAITLTSLEGDKMLFAYARPGKAELYYRVYNGSEWGALQTIANTGMTVGPSKQLSSTTDQDGTAYVAYANVTSSAGGILKVAIFNGTGAFVRIETADNTLRHSLPNIIYSSNGNLDINSLANGRVYDTRKINGVWETPFNPYGTTFNSPDRLTATNIMHEENAAVWREGTSPFNLIFAMLEQGTVEGQTTVQNSPGYADYFEGERRVTGNSNGTLFAFYYDGSNIMYKKSSDFGHTWTGLPTSTGTGTIAPDNFRWTIAHTTYNGTDRIALLYYAVSGSSTDFYAKTFEAMDSGLVLVSTANLFSAANDGSCSPTGTCAAAAGSSDSNSTLFAAYRWKSGGDWHYRIMKSEDGGSSWSTSQSTVDVSSTSSQFPITITFLNSTRMLFAYSTYESGNIYYRIFDGGSWGPVNTISAGISTNSVKQLSSGSVDLELSNGAMNAYVAFLASGNQGTLKVAKFSSNGFYEAIETADSTKTHWLPSISVTSDGTMHIYSLDDGVIYDTNKAQAPIANLDFEQINLGIEYEPVAHWQFENDTLDFSENSNNGTKYGNTVYVDGLGGLAVHFDGSGDYVRVPDSSSLDISNNITISAWVYLDSQTSTIKTIVRKPNAYALVQDSNNKARLVIYSGGVNTPVATSTTTLQTYKWYHLVGTYDGSNMKIYVNGVLEKTQSRTGSIDTSNDDLYIGSGTGSGQYLNGTVDDVLIYNKALTADEILSIGTSWDLRGGSINTESAIGGGIDLIRPGSGDTRSMPISATPDKLYIVDANILVSSGTAKIDLVFLDSSGTWLTNNTSPASGVAATSATGSIQHLSASWIAPANATSAIIRLINNVTGGSVGFDDVQLTWWEDPVTPYGTEFYYIDQLTAQIANSISTGVLWQEGDSSPYSLVYAGQIATKKSGDCNFPVDADQRCKVKFVFFSKGFAIHTPGKPPYDRFTNPHLCWVSVISPIVNCIDTNIEVWFPTYIKPFGHTMKIGSVHVTANSYHAWWYPKFLDKSSPAIKNLNDAPRNNIFGLDDPVDFTVVFVYKSTTTKDQAVLTYLLRLTNGYD